MRTSLEVSRGMLKLTYFRQHLFGWFIHLEIIHYNKISWVILAVLFPDVLMYDIAQSQHWQSTASQRVFGFSILFESTSDRLNESIWWFSSMFDDYYLLNQYSPSFTFSIFDALHGLQLRSMGRQLNCHQSIVGLMGWLSRSWGVSENKWVVFVRESVLNLLLDLLDVKSHNQLSR